MSTLVLVAVAVVVVGIIIWAVAIVATRPKDPPPAHLEGGTNHLRERR